MSTGFRMDAPFKEGVPYISRDEEQQARIRALNRDCITDINLGTLDAEIENILRIFEMKEELYHLNDHMQFNKKSEKNIKIRLIV